MAKPIQFTRQDTLHAAIGVIPGFVLICFGYLTPGIAFAIGLLLTSLLGIAPGRKLRLIYGVLGCLFGVGVYIGSYIVNLHTIWIAALIFLVVSFVATIVSSKRPAGGLLLALIIPSLAVGTSYSSSEALGLTKAFMLGSIWSSLVSLMWPEFPPSKETRERLMALQPANVKTYGLLLGLAAATSVLVGYHFDAAHAGWVATAAMLIMREVAGDGWHARYRARPIDDCWHLARCAHHPPMAEPRSHCVRGCGGRDPHHWCQKQQVVHYLFRYGCPYPDNPDVWDDRLCSRASDCLVPNH